MKKFLVFTFIIVFFLSGLFADNLTKRIKKYSGSNAQELLSLLKTTRGDTLKYVKFLLKNSSANDLAALSADYLLENVRYAIKSRKLPYATYPEDIFLHFVLPHRISQEPLQRWRKKFYDELYPKIKDVKDIEKAAIILNLWANEQLYYKSTHGRDQAPLTSIKRGYGRCEEMMILYMAGARSVGIPVRSTSAPYWNFTNNNHAWVEVWTPDGWKYLGDDNALNDAWFTNTTKRATLVVSEAFGNFDDPDIIKQENNVTYLSSIKNYTTSLRCKIKVVNEKNKPVKNAKVSIYAASWGGAFPMFTSKTNKKGVFNIRLGRATVFLTAYKNGKFGFSHLNTMKDSVVTIKLSKNKEINTNFNFLFPLPEEGGVNKKRKYFFKDIFKKLKELSTLRREKRLNNQKHTSKFIEYYDKTISPVKCDSSYFKKRNEFIKQTDQLAGNAENFLKIFKSASKEKSKYLIDMINEWDIKELCEIPDSSSIAQVLQIYQDARNRYAEIVPDSIFVKNTIHRTWRSAIPPENGWHKDFYMKIKHLANSDLSETVYNVLKWIDDQIEIDKNFVWTYFSGSLNPNQILNMHYIPKWYRTKLINSALKDLGVPVKWDARLEYWNGKKFIPVEKSDKKSSVSDKKQKLVVSIYVDGKKQKADPWNNFLISTIDEDGKLTYIDFDGENDSLNFVAKYRPKKAKTYYLESFVRNSNGDANFVIKTIGDKENITIHLTTPKEYIDFSSKFGKDEIRKIKDKILTKIPHNKPSIIFIRAEHSTEPETRMLNQIKQKEKQLKEKATIVVYSENRGNSDIKDQYDFKYFSGDKIISNSDYPVILLFKDDKLIFASKGYKMGIANLLVKKLKK